MLDPRRTGADKTNSRLSFSAVIVKEQGDVDTELEDHSRWLRCLDGAEVCRGAVPCSLHVWNLEKRELVRSYQRHKASIISAQFSPDGRSIMSASTDFSIRIWDAP